MQLAYVIQVLIVLVSKETAGQEIVLRTQQIISPCGHGLRSGIDKYVFAGTIGQNYSALVNAGWFTTVVVEILTNQSQRFQQMCEIFIGQGGLFCGPSTFPCYCSYVNARTCQADVVVNYTAQPTHGGAIVRAVWFHPNGSVARSANNVTLPCIYDPTVADLNLTIVELAEPLKKAGSCAFSLPLNPNVSMELCCSNTATPCYPAIAIGGKVVANNDAPCVNYTSTIDESTVDVSLLYSVCTQDDFKLGTRCAIHTVLSQHGAVSYHREVTDYDDDIFTPQVIIIGVALFILGCTFVVVFENARKGPYRRNKNNDPKAGNNPGRPVTK